MSYRILAVPLLPTVRAVVRFSCFDDTSVLPFIQISDTHISRKPGKMMNVNFRLFTSTILPEFSPHFVIHTGDITDGWKHGLACTEAPLSSRVAGEIEEEWIMYRSSLLAGGYYNKSVWMDVRGNHDNTNQNSTRHHFYFQYGTCRDEDRVYNRVVRQPFGNYCFIGVDATLSPCRRRAVLSIQLLAAS